MVEEPMNTNDKRQPSETKPESGSPVRDFIRHQAKAAEEIREAFASLLPPDFRTHSRAARKEWIASIKVVVDAVDRELSKRHTVTPKESSGSGPSTTGKTKVKVEVS